MHDVTSPATRPKRCFIGLRLDRRARGRLEQLQSELSRLQPDGAAKIRLVPATSFHLTLKFLGATPPARIEAVVAALAGIACALPSRAELRGLGAFPSIAAPRVVYAAVAQGREPLAQLAVAIDAALATLGFAPDDKQHVPHVTLARVERARPRGAISRWLSEHAQTPIGSLQTETLVLFESHSGPAGSRYTALAEIPTGPR